MSTDLGTIAVFGATGQQGGAVVNSLLRRGATVRALVRDPASPKAQALAARGVELVDGDADRPETLVAALQGVDAFFFMTSPPGGMQNADTEGETRQGMLLARAAVESRVPHLVFNSVGGAERHSGVPHFESKRRVEEHMEALDARVSVVRPVYFMENLAWSFPALEDGELVFRAPLAPGVPLQMIAVQDIGEMDAAVLLGQAEAPDGGLEIAGDELTGEQIAAAFGDAAGLPARFEPIPLSALDGQDDMQRMYRWFAQTPGYQADIEWVRTMDPGLLSFRQWLDAKGYTGP